MSRTSCFFSLRGDLRADRHARHHPQRVLVGLAERLHLRLRHLGDVALDQGGDGEARRARRANWA
jgi:hypothetical protein